MTRCWSTGIPIYEKLHEVGEIVISRSNHWRAKYQRTHVPGQTGSLGVRLGDEAYYVEVWDEAEFEKA
jgi:hypothetical protein